MSQSIFKNPYVFSNPVLVGSSVGNGTLTVDRLTHFTIDQKYTVICSAIAPFTVFNVVGDKDGAVGVAVVGTQFTDEDNKIFITIQQGPVTFQIGDTFEFEVRQGTDLNQQNIDAFDELPQKNFGTGITGQTKGNHNIRFNLNPKKASRTIQDLEFFAKTVGSDGNGISIQYLEGTVLTAAKRTIQAITFEAAQAGSAGNGISIEYAQLDLADFASVVIGDVQYDADVAGTAGNNISIQYIGGGTAGSEIVSVVGTAITIQIEDGVTTSDDIEVAIALSLAANALVDTGGLGETGAEPQYVSYAPAPVFLTGGTDQSGDTIQVVGNHIKINFDNGVSTAQEVYDSILSSAEAITLITPTITGVPEDVMYNPVATTFLTGGADDVGQPGNEFVEVDENLIKVTFNDGLSTASQIKTAIEANLEAAALVDITLLGDGSEMQSSPKQRTYLAGGSAGGDYAFNTDELDDPDNFFEGNAPIIHNGQVNQGDEVTFGETIKKGKVTLDDDIMSNDSGPVVENAQKTINNLIQNHKVFLVTVDNSKVIWNVPNLQFDADIAFVFPETNVLNKILVAGSPIVINDGEHAYVTLNREVNSDVVVTVATTIPTGENVFRLFSRRGDDLIWYDNTLQRDKKKIRIGEGGGGGTAFQEQIGVGNGAATNFPLTFIPSNEQSILVICSYIRGLAEYTYNPIGNQIQFTTPPAAGQVVYVFYLTDGETLEVPTPTGLLNSYVHTLTLTEVGAKEFTLQNIPAQPSKILVDMIGGGPMEFNLDFTVSVDKFQWAGYALDGLLSENDKVRLYFYS